MTMRNRISVLILVGLFLLNAAAAVEGRPLSAEPPPGKGQTESQALFPEPVTWDQVTHNQGNIVTTIDNWGVVGGYPGTLPSGEWPRNSGHDYLAEIRYWMGAINGDGDTLVANSYDDFQAIPMPINGSDDYRIYLTSDTTRYFDYDPDDTVGLGLGQAAHGWRVWHSQDQAYDYNETYNSLASSYVPGGPTSLQDSHYRFRDDASGQSLMGLELTHSVYQWNYCYNEDFMFIILEIHNASVENYDQFAFGLYVDIDVGGLDGHGGNGNQEDAVVYDTTEGIAYIYDVVGTDPGWGPTVTTGLMGTKLLETPGGVGMTAFRTDDWSYLPDDDPGRFAMINSAQYDAPLPPTDQFYIQCSRGISLPPGGTVRLVYALIAGQDSVEFMNNAAMAQQLYDAHFIGPEPPATPHLRVKAGNEKVYLSWDNVAENSTDPLSGINDFAGYKLYRSSDLGETWGKVNWNTGNSCLEFDYTPLAMYTVNNPGEPIQHSFIDTGLYNGAEYWYAIVAFDVGDEDAGVDPLQSGFGIAGEVPNVVKVRPVNDPAGYYEAAGTVTHEYLGVDEPSSGEVFPTVFDPTVLTGDDYEVVFEDVLDDATYWHLINRTTGDTVLDHQTIANEDPGMYDVSEGLRVVVTNADRTPQYMSQTEFATGDTTIFNDPSSFYGPVLDVFYGFIFSDKPYRPDFEFRYTGNASDAWGINDPIGYTYSVPFEVWNVSTGERVSLAVYDFGEWIDDTTWQSDGTWDTWDLLIVVDYPYEASVDIFTTPAWPYHFGWMFGFDYTSFNPSVGDVFTIKGPDMNSPDDVFTFKVDGVNSVDATHDLRNIRVVPNPYFVKYSEMVETVNGQSVLQFQNIPEDCTIRIYSLSGDLMETIHHTDGTGAANWDLLSAENRQVASGIYIYHVESSYGEHMGRFAVIK